MILGQDQRLKDLDHRSKITKVIFYTSKDPDHFNDLDLLAKRSPIFPIYGRDQRGHAAHVRGLLHHVFQLCSFGSVKQCLSVPPQCNKKFQCNSLTYLRALELLQGDGLWGLAPLLAILGRSRRSSGRRESAVVSSHHMYSITSFSIAILRCI